jgi:mutator protein MutT
VRLETNRKRHFHVTAGLVWKDGKVLITKRRPEAHLGGFWEFPGGKQEESETLEACLEREMEEELGLKVRTVDRILTVHHEYESKKISLHVFECIPIAGEPHPLQCEEIRWVRPFDLGKFAFPPPDVEIIKLLQTKART